MIRGEKVILRTVREADVQTLFELGSDFAKLGEYSPQVLRSETVLRKNVAENGMLSDEHTVLLIWVENQIIGSITFFKAGFMDALEIGYAIYIQAERNQGYMSEALSLLVNFLFSSKKINRLQLSIIYGNLASKRVAEKCGFQFEGILRGAIFHRGKNHDLEIFSLLRSDVVLT